MQAFTISSYPGFFLVLLLLQISLSISPAWAQSADPFVDVKSFGAKGDGSTDDTNSIQNAINYAASLCGGTVTVGTCNATGGWTRPEVFFPAGTYSISATLTINSPMQLVGTSADIYGGSSIWTTAVGSDVLQFTATAAGSAIEQLAIRVNGTPTGGAGIHVNFPTSYNGSGMTPLRIESVSVSNTYDGIWIQAANNVFMSNLLLDTFVNDGLHVQSTLGLYLNNSMIAGGANADVELSHADGVQINNVETYRGGHGFLIDSSGQFFFQGVQADSTSGDTFAITNSADLHFVDGWAAGSTAGHGVSLANVNNFAWSGGFIRGNYASGLLVNSGNSNIAIDSAHFSANGFKNSSGTETYGIYVNQPMTNLRVVNNSFGDLGEDAGDTVQTYAIYFNLGNSASANTSVIQGNQDQHDTFTNGYTSGWTLAGNPTLIGWSVGDGAAGGTCTNGSLYSSIGVGSGALYACINSTWHAVTVN